MAVTPNQLIQTYRQSIDSQSGALAAQGDRARDHVYTKYASGNSNINHDFSLDIAFRLVFIRVHFAGGAGTANMTIANNSAQGSAHDTRLATVAAAGTNSDVFFIPGGSDVSDPSAWVFQTGDTLNIKWTNPAPGTMNWGLEIGLAIAA